MFPPLTPAVRSLLIANVAVFLLQNLLGNAFTDQLVLCPLGADEAVPNGGFMPWQEVAGGVAHAASDCRKARLPSPCPPRIGSLTASQPPSPVAWSDATSWMGWLSHDAGR